MKVPGVRFWREMGSTALEVEFVGVKNMLSSGQTGRNVDSLIPTLSKT